MISHGKSSDDTLKNIISRQGITTVHIPKKKPHTNIVVVTVRKNWMSLSAGSNVFMWKDSHTYISIYKMPPREKVQIVWGRK